MRTISDIHFSKQFIDHNEFEAVSRLVFGMFLNKSFEAKINIYLQICIIFILEFNLFGPRRGRGRTDRTIVN